MSRWEVSKAIGGVELQLRDAQKHVQLGGGFGS